ncbi:hypothetical protein JOB18_012839 [Solea senegalensis]|uniref:Uncharacterized protein n=1 Tax=Solea senegalensis TaxID=28829 RepID=A0AAV6QNM1_SOLSE|nr:hypothetical protein JOB18_012839 [Solea senegalensis]
MQRDLRSLQLFVIVVVVVAVAVVAAAPGQTDMRRRVTSASHIQTYRHTVVCVSLEYQGQGEKLHVCGEISHTSAETTLQCRALTRRLCLESDILKCDTSKATFSFMTITQSALTVRCPQDGEGPVFLPVDEHSCCIFSIPFIHVLFFPTRIK